MINRAFRTASGMLALVAAASSSAAAAPTPPTPPVIVPATVDSTAEHACGLYGDRLMAAWTAPSDDLEMLEASLAAQSELLTHLRGVAPPDLSTHLDVERDNLERVRAAIAQPSFVLDPDTLYIWDTDATIRAESAVFAWAEANCPHTIDAFVAAVAPWTLLVCLPAAYSTSVVFDRLSTPHPGGRGTEFVADLRSIAVTRGGVEVKFDRPITAERMDELTALLAEPPVIAVIELTSDDPGVWCPE